VHVPRRRGDTRALPLIAVERPALLLFDGQNTFDDEGSFAGGWYAHNAADRLLPLRAAVAPVVIGLDHGGERRISELSAWPEAGHEGELDRLLDWVVGSLWPRLHDELGVCGAFSRIVVGGSSMGGLAALHAHFRHPELFAGALCMSPSFWVGGRGIFETVAGRDRPPRSRIYLDCGAREGAGKMMPIVRAMAEHLRGRGWTDDDLMFRADPRGTHSEKHWRRRLPNALKFLFRH
jgi:enterochelin esterase-like enzyme